MLSVAKARKILPSLANYTDDEVRMILIQQNQLAEAILSRYRADHRQGTLESRDRRPYE